MAARRVTAARSPETVRPSKKSLRPVTGCGGWYSISSELHPSPWPSARATCGAAWKRAPATTARVAALRKARQNLPRFSFPFWLAAFCPLMLSPPTFLRRWRLPSQPWGRKGLRPLALSRRVRRLRRPRRVLPARRAIIRSGPGPLRTGWTGAGGSLRASWDGGPTWSRAPSRYFSRSAATRGSRLPPICPTIMAIPARPKRTAKAIRTSDGPTGA